VEPRSFLKWAILSVIVTTTLRTSVRLLYLAFQVSWRNLQMHNRLDPFGSKSIRHWTIFTPCQTESVWAPCLDLGLNSKFLIFVGFGSAKTLRRWWLGLHCILMVDLFDFGELLVFAWNVEEPFDPCFIVYLVVESSEWGSLILVLGRASQPKSCFGQFHSHDLQDLVAPGPNFAFSGTHLLISIRHSFLGHFCYIGKMKIKWEIWIILPWIFRLLWIQNTVIFWNWFLLMGLYMLEWLILGLKVFG